MAMITGAQKTIVGVFGPPRCGKNTAVDVFVREHGYTALSISHEIKNYSHKLVGRTFDESEKDIVFECLNGHTPRNLYIEIGQLEKYDPYMWVSKVADVIDESSCKDFIIESVGNQGQWNYLLDVFRNETLILLGIERPGFGWDSRTPIDDYEQINIIHNVSDVHSYSHLMNSYIEMIKNDAKPRNSDEVQRWLNKQGYSR